ncbi:MAG: glycosyltransferase [Candidatus Hydrogenedentes bacterium]|nr:glycosyltransferase [Candidatus Hydrogenedentota bacterium]
MQTALVFLYLYTPFSRSTVVPWLTAGAMSFVLFFQWARWALARYNAAKSPIFGESGAPRDDDSLLSPVTLIVAARDEEEALEGAAASMAGQDYPALRVICVDDHSADATPAILDRLAAEFPNMQALHDPPLQPGWMGKQNALWTAAQLTPNDAKWLLFTDADIVFGRTMLRDAVVYAQKNGLYFLTCIPWIEAHSLLERLLLGSLWANHFASIQSANLNDPAARAIGIGAFMLVRRDIYFRCGGHAAIADDPVDDVALAALVKKAGGKMGFGRAGRQLRCRQYGSLRETLGATVRKQRINQEDRLQYFLAAIEFQLLQWVLPLPLMIAGIAAQVHHGTFSWGLSVFSLAAGATYVLDAASLAHARTICSLPRTALVLSPVLGLIRIYISAAALWGAATRKPLNWRGRTIANG